MAVKEVTEKFEASDGRKFKTELQAERHEALITARKAYEDAKSRLNHALLESQQTADGQMFKVGVWTRYYYIHPNDFGLPSLKELPYLGWNFEVDERDRVAVYLREGDRFTSYTISELYVDRSKAEQALLAAQEERLSEYADDVAELKAKLTGNMCAGGIVGCPGGAHCTSDHK